MEKAIEIKRRAQRCIQNNDIDGAVSEYEKLVDLEDSDPYHFVLLADLLFKKGDTTEAGQRYLGAAAAYEKAGLYKNAIAVCKKLMRLQLAPSQVYFRLASLHALDGLATEASLYYQQHAEYLVREEQYAQAADSLQRSFDSSNENVKALERLAEVQLLLNLRDECVHTLARAAQEYKRLGQMADGERCRKRAQQLDPSSAEVEIETSPAALPTNAPAALRATATANLGGAPPAPPVSDLDARAPIPDVASGSAEPAALAEPVASESAPAAAEPRKAPPTLALPESVSLNETDIPLRLETETASEGTFGADAGITAAPGAERLEGLQLSTAYAPPPKPAGEALPPSLADAEAAGDVPKYEIEDPPAAPEPIEASEPDPRFETPEMPVAGHSSAAAKAPETPVHAELPAEPVADSGAPGLRLVENADAGATGTTLTDVERMLSRAQECFRAGQREAASEALAGAARAYDALGRPDSAATIYRSLGKSAHATTEMLQLWLANCELRGDSAEAAQVSCELGDRSLNEGDSERAQAWFERARELDATNEVALRRLRRLSGAPGPAPGTSSSRSAEPAQNGSEAPGAGGGASGPEPGRVEVAVGRGEAVTFDLGSLISEFQRGVETQLSGDAQGHYDLAMSYREMGLLEQAVDAFRISATDPDCAVKSVEMIGRCLLDQGRFDEAIQELTWSIDQTRMDPSSTVELRFLMAQAHEGAGRREEAIAELEQVVALDPEHPEVEERLRLLRQLPESA